MEKVVSKIVALGVPGLILVLVISLSGLHGAAAITFSLSLIGPGGILGGICTLGVIALIAEALSEYGLDALVKAVITELYVQGETKESLLAKIRKYPLSESLKLKLSDYVMSLKV